MNENVKNHYDQFLAKVYTWMLGDLDQKINSFYNWLKEENIEPKSNKLAIDLGCGNGIQTIALAKIGFKVLAIDFSQELINELKEKAENLSILAINDRLENFTTYVDSKVELISCCGDTLSHLESMQEVRNLIKNISMNLSEKGVLILSFRDYSSELTGLNRIIPVRSDESRIMTCFLEYSENHVKVIDIIYELKNSKWDLYKSEYHKIRLKMEEIILMLEEEGLIIISLEKTNGFVQLIAEKSK